MEYLEEKFDTKKRIEFDEETVNRAFQLIVNDIDERVLFDNMRIGNTKLFV